MATRIINRTWKADGVFTDPTSVVLQDPTGTFGIKRNDTGATVVAAGTALTQVSTGVYQYSFVEPVANLDYTAYIQVIYHGATNYFEQDLPAIVAASSPSLLGCDYNSLVNDVGFHLFGLRHTSLNVISDGVATTNQGRDILRSIAKGLQYIYLAHRWSFLRPRVNITTYPSYATGTIQVDAAGVVTGDGTTFPSYSASANGRLTITNVGTYAIASYASGTSLTLTSYDGGAITTDTTYTIGFPAYPIPTSIDSFEGPLTFPEGFDYTARALDKVSELDVRRMLQRDNSPDEPRVYAETTDTFDPTVGSMRSITFYPVPDDEYTLTAIGHLRPTMIDVVNIYPVGIEVLAPCITESCLAAAEREIEQKDANHPDAVHNRALIPLLAMAIQRDKELSSPETLGVDHGPEAYLPLSTRRSGGINWNAGCGVNGFI